MGQGLDEELEGNSVVALKQVRKCGFLSFEMLGSSLHKDLDLRINFLLGNSLWIYH